MAMYHYLLGLASFGFESSNPSKSTSCKKVQLIIMIENVMMRFIPDNLKISLAPNKRHLETLNLEIN